MCAAPMSAIPPPKQSPGDPNQGRNASRRARRALRVIARDPSKEPDFRIAKLIEIMGVAHDLIADLKDE